MRLALCKARATEPKKNRDAQVPVSLEPGNEPFCLLFCFNFRLGKAAISRVIYRIILHHKLLV